MATALLVSPAEHRATSYRPDCEMIDGQLIEKIFGEYDHSNLRGTIIAWMHRHQREWNIRVLPEQRLQVTATRIRIPDVCVLTREQLIEPVFTRPPLLCIEILSKDDTFRSLQDRVDDYLDFGVLNIWILDPVKRRAFICKRGSFQEPENHLLSIPPTPIQIDLRQLFSDLD